jgi:outer membrane lipoprotein-sorting protein
MSRLRRVNSLLGWASVGTVLAVVAVVAGTMLASASGPVLPHRSAAQLIAGLRHASMPPAASGVITETANLGFPALPDVGGTSALSPASLLTGTHVVQFWYARPDELRLAVSVPFGESDLRVNGSQVWLWSSRSQTATRLVLTQPQLPGAVPGWFARPAPPTVGKRVHLGRGMRSVQVCVWTSTGFRELQPSDHLPPTHCQKILIAPKLRWRVPKAPCAPLRLHPTVQRAVARPERQPSSVPPVQPALPAGPGPLANLTPLQAAQRLLALAGPTTKITVAGTTTVAGRAAYQLAIAPRSGKSLIGGIVIAIDARSHLPLQVQVFARGSSSPAFQIGFTSLTASRPAKSNFTFTPPPRAHVKIVHVPLPIPPLAAVGTGAPVGVGGAVMGLPPSFPRFVLRSTDMPLDLVGPLGVSHSAIVHGPTRISPPFLPPTSDMPRDLVRGLRLSPSAIWRACFKPKLPAVPAPVPFPPSAMTRISGPRVLGGGWLSVIALPVGPALGHMTPLPAGQGPAGQQAALLHMLMAAATPVHGSWGSGRLLRTALLSALITSKGEVLIGAVTPSVLFADAALVK